MTINTNRFNIIYLLSFILHITLIAGSGSSAAQTGRSQLDIEYGQYMPVFFDTVIFSKSDQYNYGTYAGPKPFFVRIWMPANNSKRYQNISYRDLFKFKAEYFPGSFVIDSLNQRHLRYTRKSVLEFVGRDDSTVIQHAPLIYNELINGRVISQRTKNIVDGNFPVVIYHHGYEGWGHDNFLLAEYMASHGFVVVTSNFEWPRHDNGFEQGNKDIEDLILFSKDLQCANTKQIYGVGHSWGAQSLLHYDNRPKFSFKGIASLHTTMEDRNNMAEIRRLWPEVSTVMMDSIKPESPTLVFAPKRHFDTFLIFRQTATADYTYVNVKQSILHDGFVSVSNMRYFVRGFYSNEEKNLIEKQFQSYQEICQMIRLRFQNQPLDLKKYERLEILPK